MTILSKDMINAAARESNLERIVQLNCVNRGLTDVSLIGSCINLQVVSMSVNNISGLSPFKNCTKLKELYLRQNCIKNINEVKHLVKLTALKKLDLSQNPCSENPDYRSTVLGMLPQLASLDLKPASSQGEQTQPQQQQQQDCKTKLVEPKREVKRVVQRAPEVDMDKLEFERQLKQKRAERQRAEREEMEKERIPPNQQQQRQQQIRQEEQQNRSEHLSVQPQPNDDVSVEMERPIEQTLQRLHDEIQLQEDLVQLNYAQRKTTDTTPLNENACQQLADATLPKEQDFTETFEQLRTQRMDRAAQHQVHPRRNVIQNPFDYSTERTSVNNNLMSHQVEYVVEPMRRSNQYQLANPKSVPVVQHDKPRSTSLQRCSHTEVDNDFAMLECQGVDGGGDGLTRNVSRTSLNNFDDHIYTRSSSPDNNLANRWTQPLWNYDQGHQVGLPRNNIMAKRHHSPAGIYYDNINPEEMRLRGDESTAFRGNMNHSNATNNNNLTKQRIEHDDNATGSDYRSMSPLSHFNCTNVYNATLNLIENLDLTEIKILKSFVDTRLYDLRR